MSVEALRKYSCIVPKIPQLRILSSRIRAQGCFSVLCLYHQVLAIIEQREQFWKIHFEAP